VNSAEYEAMYRVEDTLWWYVGMRRISAAVLGAAPAGAAILDAGCGTGGNLAWLNGLGRGYGVDLSPLAVGFCAKRRLTRVSRASILALPFGDACFDLVTSFDVIYHLDVADDVAALREFYRVLKPGGRALIRVPALEFLRSAHDAAVHTRQRYSLGELRRKLEDAGFAVERATYANSLLFPLAAASRLAARMRGSAGDAAHESDVKPVPRLVNAAFGRVMAAEAALLGRADLPVGLSAVAVGRKPR
jgi:SAM-dependent methyltransferase